MDKEKLIGRKIRGFLFPDGTDGISFSLYKKNAIDKVGIIENVSNNAVSVKFNINGFNLLYPLSLVQFYLIDEIKDSPSEKIQAPEKGILINVSESEGNVSYKLDSFNMSAIETLGLLELISNQIKIKLNNQNPAL